LNKKLTERFTAAGGADDKISFNDNLKIVKEHLQFDAFDPTDPKSEQTFKHYHNAVKNIFDMCDTDNNDDLHWPEYLLYQFTYPGNVNDPKKSVLNHDAYDFDKDATNGFYIQDSVFERLDWLFQRRSQNGQTVTLFDAVDLLCDYLDHVHYNGEVEKSVNKAFTFDKDKDDNKLSFNEFMLWKMSNKDNKRVKKDLMSGKIDEKGQNDTVHDRFKRAAETDAKNETKNFDDASTITVEELAQDAANRKMNCAKKSTGFPFYQTEWTAEKAMDSAEKFMEQNDTNKDGVLSFAEYALFQARDGYMDEDDKAEVEAWKAEFDKINRLQVDEWGIFTDEQLKELKGGEHYITWNELYAWEMKKEVKKILNQLRGLKVDAWDNEGESMRLDSLKEFDEKHKNEVTWAEFLIGFYNVAQFFDGKGEFIASKRDAPMNQNGMKALFENAAGKRGEFDGSISSIEFLVDAVDRNALGGEGNPLDKQARKQVLDFFAEIGKEGGNEESELDMGEFFCYQLKHYNFRSVHVQLKKEFLAANGVRMEDASPDWMRSETLTKTEFVMYVIRQNDFAHPDKKEGRFNREAWDMARNWVLRVGGQDGIDWSEYKMFQIQTIWDNYVYQKPKWLGQPGFWKIKKQGSLQGTCKSVMNKFQNNKVVTFGQEDEAH
jgi:hypothetical protein